MSRQTAWVLAFVGALSLGVLALAGWEQVSGRFGASMWHWGPAPPAGTATPQAQAAGTVSPGRKTPAASHPLPEPGDGERKDVMPDLTLSKDQREYLWQVEHHGLVLVRLGFSRIAEALKNGNAQALLAILADGFEGEVLGQPREVRFEHDSTRVFRQQDSGRPSVRLNREGLAKLLLDDRRRFTKPPTVKLALMGLAPVDHTNLNGVWQGTCQLRIFGEMGSGRPAEVVLYLRYRLPKPTEELLKSDGWLRSCAITQRQIGEVPRFLMREVAAQRGIDVKRFHDNWDDPQNTEIVTGGINLCDFNRDGCLDLLVTDLDGNVLYQGRPDGTLIDVTTQVRLPRTPLMITATFADLDGDGWEDLIHGSLLLRNNEGQYFTPVTATTLKVRPQSNVIVADYDRDGKMDLYVTALGGTKTATWIKGEGGGQVGNRLWRNLGNWEFMDVTGPSGASGGNRSTFSAVWLDADEDGWPDLYVINEFGNGVLLVNRGDGTFRERSIAEEPGDFGSMGVTAGDIDNDGHIDLYVGNMYSKAGNRIMANVWPGSYPEPMMAKLRSFTTGSQLHHNLGGLKFERIGRELQVADVGWSYGPAMADLNNDGWLDIYATCGFISRSRVDPDG
ncbi:MAG: FG-GAP repeat domain-containing protein [Isosphaerales bacterium]